MTVLVGTRFTVLTGLGLTPRDVQPGSLIRAEGQIQIRDVLMGPGTPYEILQDGAPNWFDTSSVRSFDVSIPGRDGTRAGADHYGGGTRTMSVDIHAETGDDLRALIEDFQSAWARSEVDQALYGLVLNAKRYKWVRPRRCDIDLTYALITHTATATVQAVVTDPYAYGAELSLVTTPPAVDGGLAFPHAYPHGWGVIVGDGRVLATNAGNAPARWRGVIRGPERNPKIRNLTDDRILSLTGQIDAGDTLTLDSHDRSILLNGSASRFDWRDDDAEWFDLPARQITEIQFTGSDGTGELTFQWSPAYL